MANPVDSGKPAGQAASASGYDRVREQFDKGDLGFVLERLPPEDHVRSATHNPETGAFRVEYHATQTVEVHKDGERMRGATLKVDEVFSGRISQNGRHVEVDQGCLTAHVVGVKGSVKEVRSTEDRQITVKAEITVLGAFTMERSETFHPDEPKNIGVGGFSWTVHPQSIRPAYPDRRQEQESAPQAAAKPSQTHRAPPENASGGASASASGGGASASASGGGWFGSSWKW